MKENPTGREEQPAAPNMLAVRPGARPSLGHVVRLVKTHVKFLTAFAFFI